MDSSNSGGPFAEQLCSSDKKTREKAVKALERWLKVQRVLTEDDLVKLWKSLYYCMWVADKVPVQQELAHRMARLIHNVPEGFQNIFMRAYWKVMVSEWYTIDKYRLDKFMSLVRYFLNESMLVVKNTDWTATQEFVQILLDIPLHFTSVNICKGVMFHVADIFLEELGKVQPDYEFTLDHNIIMLLLDPFFQIVSGTDDPLVYRHIEREIFEGLLTHLSERLQSQELSPEQKNAIAALGSTVLQRLYNLASGREISGKNRRKLYDLHASFSRTFSNSTL